MTVIFASCKVLSVKSGGVTRQSAYGTRTRLRSPTTGTWYRPRGAKPIAGDLLLPARAAPKFLDRQTLWQTVEQRAVGQVKTVGLGIVLGLPREDELLLGEGLDLCRDFARPFLADGLPVQIDLHEVADAGSQPGHRHAHLVVGGFAIAGDRVLPGLAAQWFPAVRAGYGDALDWPRLWAVRQRMFYEVRAIALGVPPATGMPEPKRVGAQVRRRLRDGSVRTQAMIDADVEAARLLRRKALSTPAALLDVMTAQTFAFRAADLTALLASLYPGDPATRTHLSEAVFAHEDLVTLDHATGAGEGSVFATRLSLARLRATLDEIAGLPRPRAVALPSIASLIDAVQKRIGTAPSRSYIVVVWGDAYVRGTLGNRRLPAAVREIAARQLAELTPERAATLFGKAATVLVAGIERMSGVQVEQVVARVAQAGARLELLIGPAPTLPLGDDRLWGIVAETVLGKPVAASPGQRRAAQICRAQLDHLLGDEPLPPAAPAERALPCLVELPALSTDLPARLLAMTPRAAFASGNPVVEIALHDPADWRWAVAMIEAWPEARWSLHGHDAASFIAAVERRHRLVGAALLAALDAGEGSGQADLAAGPVVVDKADEIEADAQGLPYDGEPEAEPGHTAAADEPDDDRDVDVEGDDGPDPDYEPDAFDFDPDDPDEFDPDDEIGAPY